MRKRQTSEDFLKGFDALWEKGPEVKYPNPDGWNREHSADRRSR